MKKLSLIILFLFASTCYSAETYKTRYNPFTSKLDYVHNTFDDITGTIVSATSYVSAPIVYQAGVPISGEATTVGDTTTIDLTLTGVNITADGLYTAGDNLTLTGADFDLDPSITLTNVIATDTITGQLVYATDFVSAPTVYQAGVPVTGEATTVSDTTTLDLTLTGADVKGDVILLKDLVTTAPLTGSTNDILVGADADVTIAMPVATAIADGYLSSANWGTFNSKADYSFLANNFTGTGSFTTTNTITGAIVSATTALQVGATDYLSDITGSKLSITNGILNVTETDPTYTTWYNGGSPSLTNLTASATITGAVVSATSAIQLGSDYVKDLTGQNITIRSGELSVYGSLTGVNIDGSAGTATTATNATNIGITDDTTTNATMYPLWVTANTGNLPAKVSSTKITANPSSGTVTGIVVSTTDLQIGSDYISDITGNGLSISGEKLGTVNASKSFVITSPATSGGGYLIWKTPYAITLKDIHVLCMEGTSVVGGLDECDGNGLNAVAVDSDITSNSYVNADDDGSLTNPSIDANDYLRWHNTTVTGTVSGVCVTFGYTIP